MDTSRPFRTRDAVAAGAPTRGVLAGPRFRSPFRGTHVDAAAADDLVSRARAAVLLADDAVVGGYAAAALHGADCGPRGAPVDLVVGPRRLRSRSGLRIHQDVLRSDEIEVVDGVRVTSPVRTAHDLVRDTDFVEGVVALDALAAAAEFEPAAILEHVGGRPRPRGHRRLAPAVEAADAGSASPPETRLRLALAEHGVPRPVVQCLVPGVRAAWTPHVDLGWPELKVAVEYQGDLHRRDPERWRQDQERFAVLAAAGWLVIPATWEDLYLRPATFAVRVREALAVRAAERGACAA